MGRGRFAWCVISLSLSLSPRLLSVHGIVFLFLLASGISCLFPWTVVPLVSPGFITGLFPCLSVCLWDIPFLHIITRNCLFFSSCHTASINKPAASLSGLNHNISVTLDLVQHTTQHHRGPSTGEMHLQTTTLVCVLLAATAEAGPLGSIVRREGASRYQLARRNGTEPSSSSSSSKLLEQTPSATIVTALVPDQLLSVTTTSSASQTSRASSPTLTSPTTTQTPPTEEEEAIKAPLSSPVAQIPTIVTDVPSPTATVTPAEFADNVAAAKDLNALFSTLTGESACTTGQAACIDGALAFCTNGRSFDTLACPAGTGCYALPMTTAEGVGLGCVSKKAAEDLLGGGGGASGPAVSSAVSSAISSPAVTSSSSEDGKFTRTATITQSTGAVTITMTVDPNRDATTSSSSTASRPTDVLEVFPINDDEPTTTLTTTVVESTATTTSVVPAITSPAADVPEETPTRTRTRNRGPRPTATPTESSGGDDERGGQPTPTQAPANPDRSGPGDDTRVTFTLVETVTVTEKEREVVTVTVAAPREAGTVVVIKRGWW
ncbi:hypothetical protein QBC39DRAFT_356930 [Podospora conica]|nr:hypothetical protein QBC39DRAFT_356930 [Schizothecium conicum]